jgi:outer membrane protein assembly factor BamB
MYRLLWSFVLPFVVIGSAPALHAADPKPAEGEWPQWRGPNRTNVSTETGLLKEWPEAGPPLLWKAEGLGSGVGDIALSGGRIYSLGYRDKDEFVTAREMKDGKEVWAVRIGPVVPEAGIMRWLAQRTPTVDGEFLYAFTAGGDLVCLETAKGKERWRKSYPNDFGGKKNNWGFCDFPLVDGAKLICTPGGPEASVVALDKITGEVIWKSVLDKKDRAAYAATLVAEVGGVRHYVCFLDKGLVGISAKDGKLLWRYDRVSVGTSNTHTPTVLGDRLFCANGFGGGCAFLKLSAADGGVTVAEEYKVAHPFDSWLGNAVVVGEYAYFCDTGARLTCLEVKTGKSVWRQERPVASGRACLTYADGHAYIRHQGGKVALVRADATGNEVKGSFTPPRPETQEPTWTFPVVAGGRLYLRDQDVLLCYDVKANKREKPEKPDRPPDAVFVPTPQDVVEKMLELAAVKKKDLVYDLGCGDGRIVVTAAKKYGCKAVGYDIDPDCVELSRDNVKKQSVGDLVQIEKADIFTLDLNAADVIALYLLPKLNVKLLPQLEKLKPGSRIVSHQWDIAGVQPDRVVTVESEEDGLKHTLYLWTVPFKKDRK